MEQRGRKSVAELAIVAVIPGQRPEPPEDLTESQAEYWRLIVATKPAEWWKEDSAILLKAYCRASVAHDVLSAAMGETSPHQLKTKSGLQKFERLRRLQTSASVELAQLATKLRLTPQSRYDHKTAHTADKSVANDRPWAAPKSA